MKESQVVKMDLNNFVQNDSDGSNVHTGSNHDMSLANHDIALTNEDMNDVMKVLTDLDGYDVDGENGDKNLDSLTSVQDVSKVVDKSVLADEKLSHAMARQFDLERRFSLLERQINQKRCQIYSGHVADEITTVRAMSAKVAPPPQPTHPSPLSLPPPQTPTVKLNPFSFPGIRPPIMPEGIFLPNVPSPQIAPSLPTTPLAPSSLHDVIKIKDDLEERKNAPAPVTIRDRAPPPTIEEKRKTDEVLGQLDAGLRHLIQSYDSDATESSSGGESCDELEEYTSLNQKEGVETGNGHYLPIRKRAKYRWLANRSSVASRWTWLTAQISDLEYRIRQQTEFYRQVRTNKGVVTLLEPPVSAKTLPSSVIAAPAREITKRTDSNGRRIVIKEPLEPEVPSQPEEYLGAARTRTIRPIRKRLVLSTKNFYQKSTRAAKESTVQCNCIHPYFWCAICYGRRNHVQAPDPISHETGKIVALLDHSYHQVLSSKNDISLDIQMSHKMKNRDWLSRSAISQLATKTSKKNLLDVTGVNKSNKERLEAKRKLKKKLKEEGRESEYKRRKRLKEGGGDVGGTTSKKKLKLLRPEKRRKSITVHHHSDGTTSAMMDLTTGDNTESTSQHQQQSSSTSTLAIAEQIRRKRETAFDIDNIVIPYSMAASVRVEKLKYKEILTPTWRLLEDEQPQQKTEIDKPDEVETEKEREEEIVITAKLPQAAPQPVTLPPSCPPVQSSLDEELSDVCFEIRHAKAEIEERKRWQLPLNKSAGANATGGRSRSRRQDSRAEASSGCNTPDPMSPGAVVDSLEVTTRPSTPVNEDSNMSSTSMAASIRYRRRTSSATKSRDRNPSEDTQSSRCTTPVVIEPLQEDVLPYEPRKFPLTDDDYNTMVEDMPDGYDIGTPEEGEVCAGLRVVGDHASHGDESANRSSPAIPFSSRSSSDEDEEDDPDWCADDPDDPEWTGREEGSTGVTGQGSSSSGSHQTSQGKRRTSTSLARANL